MQKLLLILFLGGVLYTVLKKLDEINDLITIFI